MIFENKVTFVKGENTNSLPLVEYAVDDLPDINNLPGLDKIQGGSSAFVINTGDVYMLGSGGWRKL